MLALYRLEQEEALANKQLQVLHVHARRVVACSPAQKVSMSVGVFVTCSSVIGLALQFSFEVT